MELEEGAEAGQENSQLDAGTLVYVCRDGSHVCSHIPPHPRTRSFVLTRARVCADTDWTAEELDAHIEHLHEQLQHQVLSSCIRICMYTYIDMYVCVHIQIDTWSSPRRDLT